MNKDAGDFFFGLMVGGVLGAAAMFGLVVLPVVETWKDAAVKGGNAHYDTRTGGYVWDGWNNDLKKAGKDGQEKVGSSGNTRGSVSGAVEEKLP